MQVNDFLKDKMVIVDWRSDKERNAEPLTYEEAIYLHSEGNQNLCPRFVGEIREFADGSFYGVDPKFLMPFPLRRVISS